MSNDKEKTTLKVNRPSKLQLTKTIDGGSVQQRFTRGQSKKVTVEVRKTRTFTRKTASNNANAEEIERKKKLAAIKHSVAGSSPAIRDKEQLNKATSEVQSNIVKSVEIKKEDVVIDSKAKEIIKSEQDIEKEGVVEKASVNENKSLEEELMERVPSVNTRREIKEIRFSSENSRNKKTERTVTMSPIMRKIVEKEEAAKAAVLEANKAKESAKEEKKTVKPLAAKSVEKTSQSKVNRFAGQIDAAPVKANEKDKKKKIRLKGDNSRRSSNKMTITQALGGRRDDRMRSLASVKRQRAKARRGDVTPQEKILHEIIVPEIISVQDLANRMAERTTDVVKELMKLGMIVKPSQDIDADTAELVVAEFGHTLKRVSESDVENILTYSEDDEGKLQKRAPVITIMGHVDHGKTSLLDVIRKKNVVSGEAGGITQHIGAYQIEAKGQVITFLDTPGHEAFTAMRSRGASVTDIVILVVAADDGIKTQTIEAINHAKAAGVPIIVAINKIDKPDADPTKTKNELMQYDLLPEEFGGEIQVTEVSAKKNIGLDKLIDAILLQSEILELQAPYDCRASGAVIEARIDKNRGVAATLLVQKGTLRIGEVVVAGKVWGKARALINDKNTHLNDAIPSQPIEILGLSESPLAGDEFAVVDSEKVARDITEYRIKKDKDKKNVASIQTLDQLFVNVSGKAAKELILIIKGDVQGSIEAIIGSISKFSGEEVAVRVLHSGVGAISESDVSLAETTGAIIFGFNVRANNQARTAASENGVDIRYYSVIYDLVNDVRDALSGMLSPTLKQNIIGYADIREVFNITKAGKIAGCMITEGLMKRGAKVRLLREDIVIHEGSLKTLKRFKDEVKEVKNGYECGMAFENYEDIHIGDKIEAFEIEEIARKIEIE